MQQNLRVAFLSNQDFASARDLYSQSASQVFFESLELINVSPDLHQAIGKNRKGTSNNRGRSDLTVGGTFALLSQINRLKKGVLVLQLTNYAETSFAGLIVQHALKKGWLVYVFGMDALETAKYQTDLSFKFNPEKKTLSPIKIDNLQRIFSNDYHTNQYQLMLQNYPVIDPDLKKTFLGFLQPHQNIVELVEPNRLNNLLLVLDSWYKYVEVVNLILSGLEQNLKSDVHFQAKSLLSLMLLPQQVLLVKKKIAPLLPPDARENLEQMQHKGEFLNFVHKILANPGRQNLYPMIQQAFHQVVIVPQIMADVANYKKVVFFERLHAESVYCFSTFNRTIVDVRKRYNESLQKQNKHADALLLDAKKLYLNHLTALLFAQIGQKFIPTTVKNPPAYQQAAKQITSLDVFAVDRILLNPWVNVNMTQSFVLSKVLPQIKLSTELIDDLIFQFGSLVNPCLQEILQYAQQISVASDHKLELLRNEAELNRENKLIDRAAVTACYVSLSSTVSAFEFAFAQLAKRSLGIAEEKLDGQPAAEHPNRFGLMNVVLQPWSAEIPLSFRPASLYSLYMLLLKKHLSVLYREYFEHGNRQSNNHQTYDCFLSYLYGKQLYFGYHQLAWLLTKFSICSQNRLNQLGYFAKATDDGQIDNPMLDEKKWYVTPQPADNADQTLDQGAAQHSTQTEKKQQPAAANKTLLSDLHHRQVGLAKRFRWFLQQVTIDQEKKQQHFVAQYVRAFFTNMIQHGCYDLFSEQTVKCIPSWQGITQIKDTIAQHFISHFANRSDCPRFVLLNVPQSLACLAFFCRHVLVDSESCKTSVVIAVTRLDKPLDGQQWNKTLLLQTLQQKHQAILANLSAIWSVLLSYNKVYLPLLWNSSLRLLSQVFLGHLLPLQREWKIQDLTEKYQAELLVFYNLRISDCKKLIGDNKNIATFSIRNLLETIASFQRVIEEKERIASLFQECNYQLSLLQFIRYASLDLKLFRQNLDRIAQFLRSNIAYMEPQQLHEVLQLVYNTALLLQRVSRQEVTVSWRYRYLNQALNNLQTQGNESSKDQLLQFFRSFYDVRGAKDKMNEQLFHDLDKVLKLKELIAKKFFFVIFPNQVKKEDVSKLIDFLFFFKGGDCQILFDQQSSSHVRIDLENYIDPKFIVHF